MLGTKLPEGASPSIIHHSGLSNAPAACDKIHLRVKIVL
jgi:hypothetical protein